MASSSTIIQGKLAYPANAAELAKTVSGRLIAIKKYTWTTTTTKKPVITTTNIAFYLEGSSANQRLIYKKVTETEARTASTQSRRQITNVSSKPPYITSFLPQPT